MSCADGDFELRELSRLKGAVTAFAACGAAAGALGSAHLLVLLAAAAGRSRDVALRGELDLAVVIPAHDEETQIVTTVRSIQACDYDPARRRIIVIADNCSDQTAAAARRSGAEVWERSDPLHRGKGHALAWAFDRVLKDDSIRAVCDRRGLHPIAQPPERNGRAHRGGCRCGPGSIPGVEPRAFRRDRPSMGGV